MPKDNAIQRIDSHEKLCRIMQKQTHDKILKLEHEVQRLRFNFYMLIFFIFGLPILLRILGVR